MHVPVLLHETIHYLAPKHGGRFVDATGGDAGHAAAIARAVGNTGEVIVLDADSHALRRAEAALAGAPARVRFINANFRDMAVVLKGEPLFDGAHQPTSPVRGDIVFENVSFIYSDGKSNALKDISFHVKPGQAIALLGSTGSGKTSLVNLLPRFHEYTSGRILLDDIELTEYPRAYLRKQIGIVEQEPFLFSRSIRENITYGVGREVSDEEVERAARAAAIHDVIMGFPDGYKTIVGEKGVTLSGGQKQRTTIARTLLKNPRILILDDSTSSVDTETEASIRDALNELMENRTTFIIAHRIQSVMIADLILVLDKGEVIQTGTHEKLVSQPDGMYRRIYDIQTRIDEELEMEISRVN